MTPATKAYKPTFPSYAGHSAYAQLRTYALASYRSESRPSFMATAVAVERTVGGRGQ